MKANDELQDHWKNQVADFLKSGLDRKTYCAQNNLKIHSLDYWRAKLNARPPASKEVDASAKWVTLQVSDRPAGNAGTGIGIRIGRFMIEVDSGFDHGVLADVL
jgi:hypothetical protein